MTLRLYRKLPGFVWSVIRVLNNVVMAKRVGRTSSSSHEAAAVSLHKCKIVDAKHFRSN